MIGSTISHYKILEKLGEGGMGIVYKAQDTTLNRTIALKFLPDRVNKDETAKARFLQEAQAAAGLNHPNICTIFGVEEYDGQLYMAMEYVEGGTLGEKIPFAKIDDAITIATQIGDALQEAHAKGIVHRDIKADNIMLSSKGQAKVMDFGLAKLKGAMKLTRTSSTVGTLGYMAPEQIQGGEVDHRSDIFSFGVLLFEMLTGRLPFRGEHEAAMLYSIVNEEPQNIAQLVPDLSPIVVNLIQRCLEKDLNDRYQHFDDIVADLRRSQKKTSRIMRSTASTTVHQTMERPVSGFASQSEMPSSSKTSNNSLIRYGGIGVAVVVIAFAAWFFLENKGITVNPDMKTTVLQVPFTEYSYPSLSPDGKWLAFPAADANRKWDIYYMHVGGGSEPRKITSDATAFIQQSAQISPDGGQIVYEKPNSDYSSFDIFSISALGGTSRKLAEKGNTPQWSPDGQRVGFIRTPRSQIRSKSGMMEFWTVAADGSDLRCEYVDSLFVTTGDNFRYSFCWSPDGKSIAWIRSLPGFQQKIIIHSLAAKEEHQLTDGNENIDAMVWTVDDRIIFSSNRGGNTNLWVVPASGGEAVQITKGAGPDIGLSVASTGNEFVYLQQQRVGYIWMANIDGTSLRQISFDERSITDVSFSPDKKSIAFAMNDPDPLKVSSDVFVMDRDGNNRRRLTNGTTRVQYPTWSPDGRRILYNVRPSRLRSDTVQSKIFVVDVENPGTPKFAGYGDEAGWLDSDHILSWSDNRTYIVTVSTSTNRMFLTDSVLVLGFLDGKCIAYYDLHQAKVGWWVADIQPTTVDELMKQQGEIIMPVVRGSARKLSSAPSPYRRWITLPSISGNVVQFAAPDKIRLLSFIGKKEEILQAQFPGLRNGGFDLSKDGKELVFVAPRLSSRLVLLENVFK
ncbi:MAG: protein kinase [Bacteroidota bacterium]|nr:protein kinase [Bacteroidota bacterium]